MVKQRGSAMVTALFLVTLIAIIATAMSARLHLDIYRTNLVKSTDKLYLASQVITFWAIDRLSDPKQPLVRLNESGKVLEFPAKLSGIYPEVITRGAIYDLQARFNLNNVSDSTFLSMYLGLLEQVIPNKDSQTRMQLIDATINWIRGPSESQIGHDQWLDQYLKQRPVYLPSYQPMQHASELRLIIGVTPDIYRALQPYTIALPEVTPINLNTAPLPLLRALGDGLSEHDAEEIITFRNKKEIKDFSELKPLLDKFNIPDKQMTLKSQYFLAVAKNKLLDREVMHYALLKRTTSPGDKISVSVINEATDESFGI